VGFWPYQQKLGYFGKACQELALELIHVQMIVSKTGTCHSGASFTWVGSRPYPQTLGYFGKAS